MITVLVVGIVLGAVLGYIPTRALTEWRIARHGMSRTWAGRHAYRKG